MLERLKNSLKQRFLRNLLYKLGLGSPIPKNIWERQFEDGSWDYLFSPDESAHYQAINKYVNEYAPHGKILDVGCGQGVLYHYLQNETALPINYLGIDISSNAILSAKDKFKCGNFKQLDFDKEPLQEKFDVIIFNETLYYFDKPYNTLKTCIEKNLNPGGCFIISIYDFQGHNVIWKKLKEKYNFSVIEKIKNKKQQKWKVGVFKPEPGLV